MPYAGSQAQTGAGTIFEIGTISSPSTYTVIDEAAEITPAGNSNAFDEVTNLQSGAKEFIATLSDPGTFSFSMNRVPGNTGPGQAALITSFNNLTTLPYRVTFKKGVSQTTTGDKITFLASVESLPYGAISPAKAVKLNCTLKVSGPFTFTPGS